MVRGDEENNCLQLIRFHWSEMEFSGLSDSDKSELKHAIFTSMPNQQSSMFPDFVFDGGFVEHFKITASRESRRKGSEQKRQESNFQKECATAFREMKNKLDQQPPEHLPTGQVKLFSESHEMFSPEYQYEFYISSFQNNFTHHINSLQKYSETQETGIFLIEYTGALLKVMKDGYFTKRFYSPSLDIKILHFLQSYKDILQYIVFTDGQHCEALSLKNIESVIEKIPDRIYFEFGRLRNIHLNIALTI